MQYCMCTSMKNEALEWFYQFFVWQYKLFLRSSCRLAKLCAVNMFVQFVPAKVSAMKQCHVNSTLAEPLLPWGPEWQKGLGCPTSPALRCKVIRLYCHTMTCFHNILSSFASLGRMPLNHSKRLNPASQWLPCFLSASILTSPPNLPSCSSKCFKSFGAHPAFTTWKRCSKDRTMMQTSAPWALCSQKNKICQDIYRYCLDIDI